MMNKKRPRIGKIILKIKNKAEGITLQDFRQLESYSNQKSGTGTKTYIQINRIEQSPEINPHTYSQLIFNKGGKLYNGEKTVSSASSVGKVGQPYINQ